MGRYVRRDATWFIVGAWITILLGVSCLPGYAQPRVRVHSQTLVRGFERDTVEEEDTLVLPVYQYVGLDVGNAETEKVTLHVYGWGRGDLAGSDVYEDNPDGDLTYGYAQWALADDAMHLRLGRQQVVAASGNETVDGLLLEGGVGDSIALSAYGGLLPGFEDETFSSEASLYGGRVGYHMEALCDIGVSYKAIHGDGETLDERIAMDLSWSPLEPLTLTGVSQYNLNTNGWAEHTVDARLYVSDYIIHPYVQRFEYDDLFSGTSKSFNPFSALAETEEVLTLVGGDLYWRGLPRFDLGAKVENYTHDETDRDALYTSGLLTWYVGEQWQLGGELGLMDGDQDENSFHLGRLWFHWDNPFDAIPTDFITGDAIYASYEEEIFEEDTSLFLSLGVGRSFMEEALSLKLSSDYSSDPYFESDARVMVTLTYNLNP
ncbi:hypothetical protein DSLASN_07960 [Desulfoluna limicola]|uniref:Uncharacterized protein n=1 Tax=Desulfoluna limicola TaxID=2810562 RepID=A0ABM7PDA4_9BACT|nr:hypothetical protein [Desulfoluna limicola]BCS95164.1 hypothetical protein DSLASN_07960 [Desulfoluna limicola]